MLSQLNGSHLTVGVTSLVRGKEVGVGVVPTGADLVSFDDMDSFILSQEDFISFHCTEYVCRKYNYKWEAFIICQPGFI